MQRLLLSVIVILSFFACAKEIDETIPKQTILGDPELRDETLVSSIVKNFDGNAIPDATIKFVADNYEKQIESDDNGHFQFTVPSDIKNGFIVIAKEQHDRVIVNYDNSNLVISRDIRLPGNQEISNIDLSFDLNNSFHITGRLVDEFGQALSNMEYYAAGILSNGKYKDFGHYFTDASGMFSILDEKENGVTFFTFNARSSEEICSETVMESIAEQLPMLPLDDLVFINESESEITVDVNQSMCNEDVLAKLYYPYQQDLGLKNIPLGEVDFPFCSNYNNSVVYIGFEDATGNNFNGGFYDDDAQLNNYLYSSCTPSDFFFDINYDGTQETLDVQFDTTRNTFAFNIGNDKIYLDLEVSTWPSSECLNSNCDSHTFVLTAFKRFALQYNSTIDFSYDDGDVFMDNVVNNDAEISGVIMSINENKPPLKIRFRVEKI